ncbi:DNA replication/repair protein RecF [Wenxinia marina]|uniref:DNA replication and repair protein RecF n=1 Tax=Wenxinia marina DSM 24838 TaxID=1123501 RepID=A0A0D0QFQ6_9RHOB|nr:DNA replication/repair protein RecF [Wenxinia marina]KIQ71112.1 DNA replication and repair protein RecF [Wenxinia marina DSM 24838]GGL54732.1 DNA replication and repair protein RecF [Wenxinia marina]
MTAVLSRLALSHFRSHRRTVLDFDGRPVAMWGPNGAGKTNLAEAVSLLSPGRGLRRAAAEDLVRRPEALGWKIVATLAGHEVETWAEAGQARALRVDGKAATQTSLAALARVLWLVPSMDRLWIEGAEGRRRFLDRMTLSFFPGHAEAALDYERAMRERNRLLKDMVRDAHWYGALEAQMGAAGEAIVRNRAAAIARLAYAVANADTAFPAPDLSLTHPDRDLPQDAAALTAALAESRPRDLAAGRTLVGPHRADLDAVWAAKGVAARDCSTGEQKALLISLILANARALAAVEGEVPILILDEVSAHLDAQRRARLYDEIVALGAQAFLTGTGPELFEELGARAQYVEVAEEGGVSIATERPAP